MTESYRTRWTRREFVNKLMLGGTASLLGLQSARLVQDLFIMQRRTFAAEPPPETTTIRLSPTTSICQAPLHVAEDFLRLEGFTNVQYVKSVPDRPRPLATGDADIGMTFVGPGILGIEAGNPTVLLAGVHAGCFELFGGDRVRAVRDLKGKSVAVAPGRGTPEGAFLVSIAAYVGMDPFRDINWVMRPASESIELLAEGKIDALITLPPTSQELRSRKIGRVVLDSMMDRPWSQYFCCMVSGNREFVQKHPVATKRVLRAILKAAEGIPREPARAARLLLASGITQRYDYALQTMREIPYAKWRDYDPEDTVRFYGLRLHEGGMVRTSPHKIVADGTDFRFIRELRRELRRSGGTSVRAHGRGEFHH